MMTSLRVGGMPSPIAAGTADAGDLKPAIPFDAAAAAQIAAAVPAEVVEAPGELLLTDPFEMPASAPAWLRSATQLIRPICVGALMAIPTVGAATVGAVAMISEPAATRMTRASVAFLAGIPADVLLLIGALAGGYTVAKSVEKLAGKGR